jgi:hypothetical protein
VLSPEVEPRLQTLVWEDSLPPSPALLRLAAAATPLIDRWDEAAARGILAPSVDLASTRKQLAQAGATYGACKVERLLSSDGAAKAKFLIACADGAVELSQTIDVSSQRITRVALTAPRTMANCAP